MRPTQNNFGAATRSGDLDRLLTVEEVAELLGISTAWVRQHASGFREPRIPSVKLGKSVRFRRQAIQMFITSMEGVAS